MVARFLLWMEVAVVRSLRREVRSVSLVVARSLVSEEDAADVLGIGVIILLTCF